MTILQSAIDGGIAERLAYADWLEERGEPLAELIRLVIGKMTYGQNHPEYGGCGCDACRVTRRIAELRPIIEAPLLAAIDAAWPKCATCRGKGRWDMGCDNAMTGEPIYSYCDKCGETGRVGKLWRECPACNGKGEIPYEMPEGVDKRCRPCDGFGTLLEVPCKVCRHSDDPGCHACNAGYIRSPIADLWDYCRLTYHPAAKDAEIARLKAEKEINDYLVETLPKHHASHEAASICDRKINDLKRLLDEQP